jgi:hypothetical protein
MLTHYEYGDEITRIQVDPARLTERTQYICFKENYAYIFIHA